MTAKTNYFFAAVCALALASALALLAVGVCTKNANAAKAPESEMAVSMPETSSITIDEAEGLDPIDLLGDRIGALYERTLYSPGANISREPIKGLKLYHQNRVIPADAELSAIASPGMFSYTITANGAILREFAVTSEDIPMRDCLDGVKSVKIAPIDADASFTATRTDDGFEFTLWQKHKVLYKWSGAPASDSRFRAYTTSFKGIFLAGQNSVWYLPFGESKAQLLLEGSDIKLFVGHTEEGRSTLYCSYCNDNNVQGVIFSATTETYEKFQMQATACAGNFIIEEVDGKQYGFFFKDASLEPIGSKIEIPADKVEEAIKDAVYQRENLTKLGFAIEDIFSVKPEDGWHERYMDDVQVNYAENTTSADTDKLCVILPTCNELNYFDYKRIYDSVGDFIILDEKSTTVVRDGMFGGIELDGYFDPYGEIEAEIKDVTRVDNVEEGGYFFSGFDMDEHEWVYLFAKDGHTIQKWTSKDLIGAVEPAKIGDDIAAEDLANKNFVIFHADGTYESVSDDPRGDDHRKDNPSNTETPLKSGVSLCPKKQPRLRLFFLCLIRLRGENPLLRRTLRQS